jgi:uncharacterized protein
MGAAEKMSRRLLAFVLLSILFSSAAFAGFDDGKAAYDKGRWIQAIINLRPAAEAGDARAMILLGNMYMEGYGVQQDTKEAFGLYHSAALKDNTDGIVALATLYQTGNGVPANIPLAVGWFERAARLGDMDAALVYAIHLYQGNKGKDFDIKPDHEAAYRWFKIVALHSNNKKQVKAAEFTIDKLSQSLTKDEVIKGDREVANWKPEMPADIGPNPEVKFVSDYESAHGKKPDGSAPTTTTPAPQQSQDVAPKPEDKKPDEKKTEDNSAKDVPTADNPADGKKAAAKPAEDKKPLEKTDDKKPDDESGVDDDMPSK